MPDRANAMRPGCALHAAAELDVVSDGGPFELPRIAERKPFLRIFLLPSVSDHLAEEAMIVTNTIAKGRNPERRHTFHEAGGQAAKTAIAQRGIRLRGAHAMEVDTQISQRGVENIGQPQISKHVGKKPTNQKLEREIVDALAAFPITGAIGSQPTMNDAVTGSQRRGNEPVPIGGGRRVLADRKRQLGEDYAFVICELILVHRDCCFALVIEIGRQGSVAN